MSQRHLAELSLPHGWIAHLTCNNPCLVSTSLPQGQVPRSSYPFPNLLPDLSLSNLATFILILMQDGLYLPPIPPTEWLIAWHQTVGTKGWGTYCLAGQLGIYKRFAKRCQSFPITSLPFIYYAVIDLHGELGTQNKQRVLHGLFLLSSEPWEHHLTSGKKTVPQRSVKPFCSWAQGDRCLWGK